MFSLLVATLLSQVPAQNVRPQIGYVYPPCGRAGSSFEVRLGSYDWTPDMQLLVRDPRVKIEIIGPAGDWIMTPPPYWFGQKAGLLQPPLPREVPARITIAADAPLGPIRWQAANANGASDLATFMVGDSAPIVEPEQHLGPLELSSLPVVACGRISRIAETDTYQFPVAAAGLVTCRLDDRLGQPFSGVLTLRDVRGQLVADGADTIGAGAIVRFYAPAAATYTAEVTDADHSGDRGYVYRLSIEPGPQITTSVPLVVTRGQTTSVELVGWGVATGACQLESVVQTVAVPEKCPETTYTSVFKLAHGQASFALAVANTADKVEPASDEMAARQLAVPSHLTGTLDRLNAAAQMPQDRYQFAAKKGDAVRVSVETVGFHSPVDPSIAILAADGKELARNDDLPGTLDAAIDFRVPADGTYDLVVSDFSGTPPSRAHTYRLVMETAAEAADVGLDLPDQFGVVLGEKADLPVKVVRVGAWRGPISLRFDGLPSGVTPPTELSIPDGRTDLKVSLTASDQIAAGASLITVVASAKVGEKTIQRRSEPVLLATKLKTRSVVKSAVQDGGRIVNRGTTYPADVLIDRLGGYTGPVTLQMASIQQRQRRGIYSSALVVPAGVDRVEYPIFMPEWLETSLTARMILISVVQVPDPKGNLRYVTGIMDGFIVMSLEGGLLKVSHEPAERVVPLGGTIKIPVKVSRTSRVREPARIEVLPDEDYPGLFSAEPQTLPPDVSSAIVELHVAREPRAAGLRQVVIRVTALEAGKWPAVSETNVPLVIEPGRAVAASK